MEAQARAGIDIYGRVMRYAEVEQYGARYRLLRLGSCDFEFAIGDELFGSRDPEHLATIIEAIRDVFQGSVARELCLAIHPPRGISYFSMAPPDATELVKRAQFEREAKLLTDPTSGDLSLTSELAHAETLPDGDVVEWHQILALPAIVYSSLRTIVRDLSISAAYPMSSMHGIANALNRLHLKEALCPDDRPLVLAVGYYPTHFEYTVVRHGEWTFCHYTNPGDEADSVYFTLALLRQLGLHPNKVGRIFIYGIVSDIEDFAAMETIFDIVPEKLDAIPIVDLDASSLSSGFDFESYAPCIGISL